MPMKLDTYRNYLLRHGNNLAEVKKNQSDYIIDRTFTRDPNYKRVYILTRDGWIYEDVKYQIHTTPSILKDAVDYYIQFRPNVHYPIGSYVIIPDDTDFDINLTDEQLQDPFSQPVSDRTQWWFIVGRDDARSYVRYNILKCNYEFKWIWKGKIMRCFGSLRNANSYTSGRWLDEISYQLDNIINAWLPDVIYTYGSDNLNTLKLDNNQTITYDDRFMITNNYIDPKCYQVTKVMEMFPQGIIKLTLKQDDFNEKRDNVDLRICDYYSDEGNVSISITESSETGTSTIIQQIMNSSGELEPLSVSDISRLEKGKTSYFEVTFSDENIDPEWKVILLGDYEKDDVDYYTGLLSVTEFDKTIVAIKPAKAGSLSGKSFRLSVSDVNGNYYSSINLEVI